jgi:hypothetical protein
MPSIFEKDTTLAKICDDFIDLTSHVNLMFLESIKQYLCCELKEYDTYLEQICRLESQGDVIRREAESRLYSEKLIPESRGDVLGLIEATDDIIDEIKKTAVMFSVEVPEIPPLLHSEYLNLAQIVIQTVDNVLAALRIYFRDPLNAKDMLDSVYAGEKSADRLAGKIKRLAFLNEEMPLSKKMHLRYFAYHIDLIADKAEDLADRLSIAAIKQIYNE